MTGPSAGMIFMRPSVTGKIADFWARHERGHAFLTDFLRFRPLQSARAWLYRRSDLYRGLEEGIVHGRAVYQTTNSFRRALYEGMRYPFAYFMAPGRPYVTALGLMRDPIVWIVGAPVGAALLAQALSNGK
jgi:hypothetical protein